MSKQEVYVANKLKVPNNPDVFPCWVSQHPSFNMFCGRCRCKTWRAGRQIFHPGVHEARVELHLSCKKATTESSVGQMQLLVECYSETKGQLWEDFDYFWNIYKY